MDAPAAKRSPRALRLALGLALARRPRLPDRAVLLLLVACALGLRGLAGAPAPPLDPGPALRVALRVVAAALDRSYASRGAYVADAAELADAVGPLRPPGFFLRGRRLPLQVRVLDGVGRAQVSPLDGDPPGTLYVAIAADRSRAFLTALTLRDGRAAVLGTGGAPVVVQARGGTHGLPGSDLLLPPYPWATQARESP